MIYDKITSAGQRTFVSGCQSTISSGTTGGLTGATALSIGYIWHPATNGRRVSLVEFNVSWAGGVAGDPGRLQMRRITAINGAPGGSSPTPILPASVSDPIVSTTTVTFGATGLPTRATGAADGLSLAFATPGIWYWSRARVFDGETYVIEPSTAEGWEISLETGAAGPSTAAQFYASFKWLEG